MSVTEDKHPSDLLQSLDDLLLLVENFQRYQQDILPDHLRDAEEFNQMKTKIQGSISSVKNKSVPFKIVLVGRRGCGKSSILNVILGRNIAPCISHHKSRYFLRVFSEDTDNVQIGPDRQIVQDEEENSSIFDYLRTADVSEYPTIDVVVPAEGTQMLRHTQFIDSPGLGDDIRMDQVTEEHCVTADLILLVLPVDEAISRLEADLLASVDAKRELPVTFILMNKSEKIHHMENIEKVIRPQAESAISSIEPLRNLNSAHSLFFLSARQDQHDQEEEEDGPDNKDYDVPLNEFHQFLDILTTCVTTNREAIRFSHHFKFIQRSINTVKHRISEIQSSSVKWHERCKANAKSLQNSLVNNPEHLREELSTKSLSSEKVKDVVENHKLRLNQIISDASKACADLQVDNKRISDKAIEEYVDAVTQRSTETLEEELNKAITDAQKQVNDAAVKKYNLTFEVTRNSEISAGNVIERANSLYDNEYVLKYKATQRAAQLSTSLSVEQPEKSCCPCCLLCILCILDCLSQCVATCWQGILFCARAICCLSDDRNTVRLLLVEYFRKVLKQPKDDRSTIESKLDDGLDGYHRVLEPDLRKFINKKLNESVAEIETSLIEKCKVQVEEAQLNICRAQEAPDCVSLISTIEKRIAKILFHYDT